MKATLYLAWRYVAYHRVKTTILVVAITLIVYLPVGLNVLVGQSAEELTARAAATPLLLGAKGSPLELVLSSLYFDSESPPPITYGEAERVADSGLAEPIPLYVRFRVRGHPIVGTSMEYFELRDLRLAAGRPMAVLGECVLGATVAAALGVGVGDWIVSSPESVFDLAGAYPLKMRVAGLLRRAHTADDLAVFVDVKTAWVIAGLGHGHQDLDRPDADAAVLSRTDRTITANASVVEYNEITEANLGSFHFHGQVGSYPLTAVIAVPDSAKAGTILLGRYQDPAEPTQMMRPLSVMNELLDTILTIQGFVVAAIAIVGLATVATAVLVFALSLRLRRREIETMVKIGGSRSSIALVLASEILMVLAMSIASAAVLTLATSRLGSAAIRTFLLS